MKAEVRYTVENGFYATLTGGHRQQSKLIAELGFNPNIHSGMAGKGRCVCNLTQEEFDRLKAKGFNLAKRR
jgi:hypothetical protein